MPEMLQLQNMHLPISTYNVHSLLLKMTHKDALMPRCEHSKLSLEVGRENGLDMPLYILISMILCMSH